MKIYDTIHPLQDYLNIPLECSCGKTHFVPVKAVDIGAGAINRLPDYVKQFGYSYPFIVCDSITYEVAGKKCEQLLTGSGIRSCVHIIEHMSFDEATLGELVVSIPMDCDLVIGVGAGSVSDMTRYFSYKLDRSCFTVATAAPMDGFLSAFGILTVNNMKATLDAHSAEVVIGDTDILRNAPYRMTVAGYGELLSKISSLVDWEIARLAGGSDYCKHIADLTAACIADALELGPKIRERDPKAIESVMDGLIVAGLVFRMFGTTQPTAGGEHFMSHTWDTLGDMAGKRLAMHGEQVVVGAMINFTLIDELLKENIDFEAARKHAGKFDGAHWESEIRRVFGPAADEVLAFENKAHRCDPAVRLRHIDNMEKNWSEIRAYLESVPSPKKMVELLRSVGLPALPSEIGIDDQLLKDSMMYGNDVRERYTTLQLVSELGLMDRLSDQVVARLRSEDF